MGYIMVLPPGHPLVGRVVPVVRRYGRRAERQWVIELPDGSRQYVPATWCTPLAASQEGLSVPGNAPDERPSPAGKSSPLTLTVLRDLAALVRRLQAARQEREEPGNDARAEDERGAGRGADRAGHRQSGAVDAESAGVGELRDHGSPAASADGPGRSAPPDRDPAGGPASGAGEVSGR